MSHLRRNLHRIRRKMNPWRERPEDLSSWGKCSDKRFRFLLPVPRHFKRSALEGRNDMIRIKHAMREDPKDRGPEMPPPSPHRPEDPVPQPPQPELPTPEPGEPRLPMPDPEPPRGPVPTPIERARAQSTLAA